MTSIPETIFNGMISHMESEHPPSKGSAARDIIINIRAYCKHARKENFAASAFMDVGTAHGLLLELHRHCMFKAKTKKRLSKIIELTTKKIHKKFPEGMTIHYDCDF